MKITELRDHYIIARGGHISGFGKAGGVFNNKGQNVPSSARFLNPYRLPVVDMAPQVRPAVFLGHLWDHYGHFLLETMSRLWIFLEEYKTILPHDAEYVFTTFSTSDQPKAVMVLLDHICTLIGIPASTKFRVMKHGEQQRYNLVFLPDRLDYSIFACMRQRIKQQKQTGSKHPDGVSAQDLAHVSFDVHRRLYTHTIRSIRPSSVELLYISRSGCDRDPGPDMEAAIKAIGFVVIRPQMDNFLDNLATYKGARVIVGAEGSGMHNSVFCPPSTTVILLINDLRVPSRVQCYFDSIAGHQHVFQVPVSLGVPGVIESVKQHMRAVE